MPSANLGEPSGDSPRLPTPEDEAFFGRMNDPTGSSVLRGPCGDEMEFYLYIRGGVIEDIRYYTEHGCEDTKLCGLAAAKRAKGREVMDALAINPKEILDAHECLAAEGRHCAILAVSALYRAIADYLLQP
ncbi:MAG: iron-sulfur cluster assembly scaffold protein [Lentisphaeria bacterium]|nr:iron-sulfur cluster assembly scaffold protein [Lentisphaeria bacterium]